VNIVLDVSEYQSVGQLDALLHSADDEIVAVYIKATQGLIYSDDLASAFASCCIKHDTAFGYYDFLTNDQASSQALDFKTFVAKLPKAGIIPMTDCEGAYNKYAAGDTNWMDAFGGKAVTYAQLSNMPKYTALTTPKWVAQYDSMTYYRPSQSEIATYQKDDYVLWQFTSNYMGRNQDASVLLDDLSVLRSVE
jgi:GH25 family lysozyme M1 (1,4-beta-N-acetylmuramidase)